MRKVIYGLIILLMIVHQDFWWWDTPRPLVFGFIPVGLAYHALVSVLAATLWGLAVKYCWPVGVDEVEEAATAIDDARAGEGGPA
jgi:hypothetical protein